VPEAAAHDYCVGVVAAAAIAADVALTPSDAFDGVLPRPANEDDHSQESVLHFFVIARLIKDENNVVVDPGILEDDHLLP